MPQVNLESLPNMPQVNLKNQLPPGQQHLYSGMPSSVPPHYHQPGDFQYQPTGNPSQPQVLPPKEDSSKSFGSKAAEWMAKGALEEAGKGLVGSMFDKFKDDSDDESSVGAAITTGVIGFGVGLLSSDD